MKITSLIENNKYNFLHSLLFPVNKHEFNTRKNMLTIEVEAK